MQQRLPRPIFASVLLLLTLQTGFSDRIELSACPRIRCPGPWSELQCSTAISAKRCTSRTLAGQPCTRPEASNATESDLVSHCSCCCCKRHAGLSSVSEGEELRKANPKSAAEPRLCTASIPDEFNLHLIGPGHAAHGCGAAFGTSRDMPLGEVLHQSRDLFGTNQFAAEFWFESQLAISPLLVPHCADADIVHIPLTTTWGWCDLPDIQKRMAQFNDHIRQLLPYLKKKPHFMVLPRVAHWNKLNIELLRSAGITFLTIEGDGTPEMLNIPYPTGYHSHAGLLQNRFLEAALRGKELLAFQKFGFKADEAGILRNHTKAACIAAGPAVCHHSDVADGSGRESSNAAIFYGKAASSWFCPQPTGDSATRRATFDSIAAGCIPVAFEQAALHLFPFSDILDPGMLLLLADYASAGDVSNLYSTFLPAVDMSARMQRLAAIANFQHIFIYSLTPRMGLLRWDTVSLIAGSDDALTFSIKSLIRSLCARSRLPGAKCLST